MKMTVCNEQTSPCSFECFRCRFTNYHTLQASGQEDKDWYYYDSLNDFGANIFYYISGNLDDCGDEDAKRALSFLKDYDFDSTIIFKERFYIDSEEAAKNQKYLGAAEHTVENNTLKIGNFELQTVKLTLPFCNIPKLTLHSFFGWRKDDVDTILYSPAELMDEIQILPLSYSLSTFKFTDLRKISQIFNI